MLLMMKTHSLKAKPQVKSGYVKSFAPVAQNQLHKWLD
jgi:hypothetical protein